VRLPRPAPAAARRKTATKGKGNDKKVVGIDMTSTMEVGINYGFAANSINPRIVTSWRNGEDSLSKCYRQALHFIEGAPAGGRGVRGEEARGGLGRLGRRDSGRGTAGIRPPEREANLFPPPPWRHPHRRVRRPGALAAAGLPRGAPGAAAGAAAARRVMGAAARAPGF
jgi:hypothetical protein